LWATAIQTSESGAAITKTRHIGCRWGYSSLVYETDSVMFPQAKATGLTVKDWQDLVMVNQFGKRVVTIEQGRIVSDRVGGYVGGTIHA
jgi:hypothetical protein